MIKLLIAAIKYTLVAFFILFVLALYSPVKAVYVLNVSVSYCYVLVVAVGNFIILSALALLNLVKNGVA